jgi:hypothetical protein
MGFGGIKINSIKLMLYLIAFGALICLGAAYETGTYETETTVHKPLTAAQDEPIYVQQYSSTSESAEMYGHHDGGHDGGHDGPDGHHGGYDHHGYYDWLSPGGAYYWSYPSYYYSSWYYPTYTYTYYPQTYYYTTPVTYSNWYYSPVVYDPWYATNIYGIGSTTYYYSSSSSWSYHGGFFFGP